MVELKAKEFRTLKPLPGIGVYTPIREGASFPALFFGPERMVCEEKQAGECVAQGLIPVQIPNGYEIAFLQTMNTNSAIVGNWFPGHLTERNGGIYDNLRQILSWAGCPQARQEIYTSLHSRGSFDSIYDAIVMATEQHTGLQVSGLLVEVADVPNDGVVILGAAVLFVKSNAAGNWRLTAKLTKALQAVRGSAEAQLVKCTMDELVGIALVTDLPVVITSKLHDAVSVDGLLSQDPNSKRIEIAAPYSRRVQPSLQPQISSSGSSRASVSTESQKTKLAGAPRAMDIPDATTFLMMSTKDKRAVLRASGVRSLDMPRPREGKRAVDALLIPLLDEEVVTTKLTTKCIVCSILHNHVFAICTCSMKCMFYTELC